MSSAPSTVAAQPTPRFTLLALAASVLVAAALRLVGLDVLPPGIHADQLGPSLAGLDVLRGLRPFALVDYDIWLHAASFWALGVSPLAVRLLPALAGCLFPVSVYLALHRAYGRRVALLAAAVGAVAIWPVALSRSGYSISYLPVGLGLCLWQLSAGWHTGRVRHWVLAGALLAAVQYVYYPARAVVLVLLVAGLYLVLVGPRQRLWAAWPLLPVFLVGVIPLYWRTLQLDAEATRYGTVFILAPENLTGSPLAALASQAWLALSMFFYQGDLNYRHNVPAHPVFDLVLLLPAGLGLVHLLKAWRQPRTLFWLLWLGGTLGPMLLSIESPHFLRAAGSLPLVFVLPALGLDQLAQFVTQRRRRGWGRVAVAGVLLLSGANTTFAYFGSAYRANPALFYAYAGEDQALAVDINRFLGVGWPGTGWRVRSATPLPDRVVRLDRRLWSEPDRERAVRLLVPLPADATPAYQYIDTALAAGAAGTPAGADMRLIVVPGQEQPAVSLLPRGRLISVSDGPLPSWAPPGVKPIYRLYTTASPAGLPAQATACLADGIELLSAAAEPRADSVAVNLIWRATARPTFDYTVFVHVVAQGEVAAQVDAYPVAERYLTSWWRAGDHIADDYVFPLPPGTDLTEAYVRVGLYRWDTLVNLPATDCAGQALGDFAVIPLSGGP